MQLRRVTYRNKAKVQQEGGGFWVRRPFPGNVPPSVSDPFLLIDEMGPASYAPGEAVGAPAHPHRGFETVTYMLKGTFEHRDSAGHAGSIEPGDVQWMTAGSGVVHSEMPSKAIMEQGGDVHGFQIWLNLPKASKMTSPRYQEVPREQIPEAVSEDGLAKVRVIAGEALGVSAVIDTHTPIVYQHWILEPGAKVLQPMSSDHNALLYVFNGGEIETNGESVVDAEMVVLANGDTVEMQVSADAEQAAEVLLLAGKPLKEPVARYGPFVMNSMEEINQAILDYQAGKMGAL